MRVEFFLSASRTLVLLTSLSMSATSRKVALVGKTSERLVRSRFVSVSSREVTSSTASSGASFEMRMKFLRIR